MGTNLVSVVVRVRIFSVSLPFLHDSPRLRCEIRNQYASDKELIIFQAIYLRFYV